MNFLGHVIGWILVVICAIIAGLVFGTVAVGLYWNLSDHPHETAALWIGGLVGGYVTLCVIVKAASLSVDLEGHRLAARATQLEADELALRRKQKKL